MDPLKELRLNKLNISVEEKSTFSLKLSSRRSIRKAHSVPLSSGRLLTDGDISDVFMLFEMLTKHEALTCTSNTVDTAKKTTAA